MGIVTGSSFSKQTAKLAQLQPSSDGFFDDSLF